MSNPVRLPRVVIVGAGFGGIEAAKALRHAAVDLTIVDRQNHHCFQPLLYQVATAALSPADVAWPIRHMLARQRNVTVFMEEVRAIDTKSRRVITNGPDLSYDFLIIATGAAHSYFGHDEWAAFAPGLKRIEDATLIRRQILIAFERAELTADADDRRRLLTFAIVGGGPTGVELAGAIAEVARQTLPPEFRRIDPSTARILLLEAGPRILPALPEKLSAYAVKALGRLGVEVLAGTPVTGCDERGVEIGDRLIEAATIIWAAGVVASPVADWLGVPHDRAGRVPVSPDLSVPGLPDVFIAGDAAAVGYGGGRLGTGPGGSGQADGPLRRRRDCRAGRRGTTSGPVQVSPPGGPCHDRSAFRGREPQASAADRLPRLAVLERRSHLLPDRAQKPLRRGLLVGLAVSDLSARSPPDHAARPGRLGTRDSRRGQRARTGTSACVGLN